MIVLKMLSQYIFCTDDMLCVWIFNKCFLNGFKYCEECLYIL